MLCSLLVSCGLASPQPLGCCVFGDAGGLSCSLGFAAVCSDFPELLWAKPPGLSWEKPTWSWAVPGCVCSGRSSRVLSGNWSKQNHLGFYLHSAHPAPGELQGGIFLLIQLFAAVFLLLGLPDVLGSCIQPHLWFHGACSEHGRNRRWRIPEGPSGGVPSKLHSWRNSRSLRWSCSSWDPSGTAGEGSQRWWPFPGMGTCQTSMDVLMWVGVGPLAPNAIPSSLEKPQIPALLSHLPRGSCPELVPASGWGI